MRVAQLLRDAGDFSAAASVLASITAFAPTNPSIYFLYAECLVGDGLLDQGAQFYHRYLERDPADHLGAQIHLAVLGRGNLHGMPAAYVRTLFDQYAESFDVCMQGKLSCVAPNVVATAVSGVFTPGGSVLDLGCGTGLSAVPFAGIASLIDGVDLSPVMLRKASERGIYRELRHCDVVEFVSASDRKYDLVLAVDVAPYVGDLALLFDHVAEILNDGGAFALTTQRLQARDGFRLGADHRFSHSDAYVVSCGADVALGPSVSSTFVLRSEFGVDLEGGLFMLTKPRLPATARG